MKHTHLHKIIYVCWGLFLAFSLTACKGSEQWATYSSMGYDGIDVSRHNGLIDWKQVSKNRNIKYVFVKATEGYGHVDKNYLYNAQQAHKYHLKVGIYHYFTSKSSAVAQFSWFRQHANRTWQDLAPVVDVEDIRGWKSSKQLQDSLAVFIRLVKQHYNCPPIIYTHRNFYNTYLAPRFNNHHLFIAAYSSREPRINGRTYSIWQYTDAGRIKGVKGNVDLSRLGRGMDIKKLLLP